MRVKIYFFLFALLILTVGQIDIFAGTTGKIAGIITDASTGEPLFGANIVLKGTQMGAATDLNGNYAILNVSPGPYTIVVSMVGYQSVQFENVQVKVDLTTSLDVSLKETAVETEAIIVIAERSLVIKDNTGSLSSTTAEQIENLPVNSVQDILRLSAGVIEEAGRLSIRGGRTSEVAYWVNGISTTDVYNGSVGLTVENSAVQELQVISGTFNAEYGQAMSGIVNIITKQGGKDYKGQISVYTADYVSSRDEFNFYKNLVTDADPATGLTRVVSSEFNQPL